MITPTDVEWTFSHKRASLHKEEYILNWVQIDVLALIRGRKQRYDLICGRGITKKPHITLSRRDEYVLVDGDAEVEALTQVRDAVKERFVAATGSAAKPAHDEDPLYSEHVSAECRVREARLRVRDRIKQQRQDTLAAATEALIFGLPLDLDQPGAASQPWPTPLQPRQCQHGTQYNCTHKILKPQSGCSHSIASTMS